MKTYRNLKKPKNEYPKNQNDMNITMNINQTINSNVMKKSIAMLLLLVVTIVTMAQKHPVDKLFEKYAGKEGFTTVLISSKMFSLFSNLETDDEEFDDLMNSLKSIRILATDNDVELDKNINFYDEIMKELKVSEYEELMVIQEKDQNVKFLIREVDGKIVELLLVSGGRDGNALISIKGDIDLKNISKLSKSMNVEGLEDLEKIDKKKDKD